MKAPLALTGWRSRGSSSPHRTLQTKWTCCYCFTSTGACRSKRSSTPFARWRFGIDERRSTVDRATFEESLTKAQKHIETGEALIAEQRARLEEKRRKGCDTAETEATLELLEETQTRFVAIRDQLCRELAVGNAKPGSGADAAH